MKIGPRPITAACIGAAVALLVSACGGEAASSASPAGDPVRGGTLVYSYNTEAQSVDPATCAIGIGVGPCQAVYGALLDYDLETGEIEPGMAESFTTEDGRAWTLKLRPGLTFSDGTPFDAAAVAFNWGRILDPALLSPSASVAKTIDWEVVDPTTLSVTSKEVNYQLDFGLTEALAYIASPTAIEALGADFGNNPVGAGPFTLTSWARGTEMILDRNPTYWDQPRPYVDRLVLKTIPADDQRFNALQAGEVDVMAVTVQKYAARAEGAGMNVTSAPLLGGTGFRLSHPLIWATLRAPAHVRAANLGQLGWHDALAFGAKTSIASPIRSCRPRTAWRISRSPSAVSPNRSIIRRTRASTTTAMIAPSCSPAKPP